MGRASWRAISAWLVAVGVMACVSQASAQGARELYIRAAEERDNIRLSGIEVIRRHGREGEAFEVVRKVIRDRGGKEYTEVTEGPDFLKGQKVVCDGRFRYREFPGRKIALRSPDLGDAASRRKRAREFAERALDHLDVTLKGEHENVAGRRAIVLQIKGKPDAGGGGGPRRGHRGPTLRELLIDAQNYATLENREHGPGGKVNRTYFKAVDFSPRIDTAVFEYSPSRHTLVLPEPSRLPHPLVDERRAELGKIALEVPATALPRGWEQTFAMLVYFGDMPATSTSFRVTEDDVPVVLYRHAASQSDAFFDDFFRTRLTHGTPRKLGESSCGWKSRDVVYVLASRIPADELIAAARKLQAALR